MKDKKILKMFNNLIFLTPNKIDTFQNNFFYSLLDVFEKHVLNTFATLINAYKDTTKEHIGIYREDEMQEILAIIAAVEHYAKNISQGFTPKLALLNKKIIGVNCLGKAMILGAVLRKMASDIVDDIHFGHTPDHALIIIKARERYFYCNCSNQNVAKLEMLHGAFVDHGGYKWYVRSEKDRFRFPHIVIQEYQRGVINAIVESFLFLQRTPLVDKKITSGPLLYNHSTLGLKTKIRTFNWEYFQKRYLRDLNEYKQEYKKEYLVGTHFMECYREEQRRRRAVDEVVADAFEKATGGRIFSSATQRVY